MEYTLREVLAERGRKVILETNGTRQVSGAMGKPQVILGVVKTNEWNDCTVTLPAPCWFSHDPSLPTLPGAQFVNLPSFGLHESAKPC